MAAIASVTTYEYAAGTCALRLVGQLSPLSQITGRPVLARSRFYLQVYQADVDAGTFGAAPNPALNFEVSGREPQFSALTELVQGYIQGHLNANALGASGTISYGESTLHPVGLTRHRLTLAGATAAAQITELSTLQLSDLAEVLDQAEENLQILPEQASPKAARPTRPRLPLWIGSVAAVGIAAILGNQFLTTAPSPVVLSPSDSQPTTESPTQAPPSSRELPTEDIAPAADADPRPESSEIRPPVAETERSASAETSTTASPTAKETARPSPPPASARPTTPPPSPQQQIPASQPPTPTSGSQPDQASRQSAQSAPNPPSDLAPAPTSPDTLRSAPAQPESAGADADMAASGVVTAEADWVSTLTRALQQQWQPPANLTATLRYRLTLETDGTVTTVEPLDAVSAIYQNTLTLPQPNTTIPGVARGEAIAVDVQFFPNGDVLIGSTREANP
ncbi:DUF4335 domain-containing protein [Nodosilinea sp. LEGE 07088]|uniref:DUF4335 domain-containing protein n=1 Tax=Nodosilinea sp. LEGE 07088 TaxID=2777968 RepID=UPI0018800A8E|nr:DUF4335 domain-containing protein [Nodosilinea sp. LEGE 07088]MBE9136975.1 DUF4335 domain-containing protein [Nodosilinea sp. LEGE 07088]